MQSKSARLPAAFLLEFAAVLELGLWERRGLRCHIGVDLPTYREAADQLVTRCLKGPAEFNGLDAAPFSLQVLRVWTEHFAWDAPELLDAEIVLGDASDDDFVDLLAEFVWAHRDELKHLHQGDQQE